MRLYTRRGDGGETGLFMGVRVPKHHPRVEACGTVDELNAALGWARSQAAGEATLARLRMVSEDLFAIGASLATPPEPSDRPRPQAPALPTERIGAMEEWIDEAVDATDPLRNFVLPGGSPGASALHLARTVCRRAERRVAALAETSSVDEGVLRYLNRLADYLFAAARLENKQAGTADVTWQPAPAKQPSVSRQQLRTTPPHGDAFDVDVRRLDDGRDPSTAVVVVHGFKGFKDWGFFPYVCERLARAGRLVVSFNFSLNGVGLGETDFSDLDAFGRNTLSREMDDLHWMLDQTAAGAFGPPPPERICLLGHSRGGGSSIVAAAERDDVAALATWAAISTFRRWSDEQDADWNRAGVTYVANARTGQDMPLRRSLRDDLESNAARLDILSAAGRVRSPWLLVHGADDETVPAEEARILKTQSSQAVLEVVEGAGHTFEASHPMGQPPPALEDALRRTLRHFEEAAGAP